MLELWPTKWKIQKDYVTDINEKNVKPSGTWQGEHSPHPHVCLSFPCSNVFKNISLVWKVQNSFISKWSILSWKFWTKIYAETNNMTILFIRSWIKILLQLEKDDLPLLLTGLTLWQKRNINAEDDVMFFHFSPTFPFKPPGVIYVNSNLTCDLASDKTSG